MSGRAASVRAGPAPFGLRFWLIAGAASLGVPAPGAQPSAAPGGAGRRLAQYQQQAFRAALQAVLPSIVRIDTLGGAEPRGTGALTGGPAPGGFRQADGPTSGLIWSSDGHIITSSFNFVRDPSIITVTLHDGRRFVARLVARDHPTRLALLKIDAAALPTPSLLPREQLEPGRWALAAGWGHGGDSPALSVGIVSALGRMRGLAVQTDAKLSPANYGGPLFDIAGRVMGICVPLGPGDDQLAAARWYDSGVGFAIDSDLVAARVERLQQGRDLHRGHMGVSFAARPPLAAPGAGRADGLRISAPPRGPARAAGLREGDVILRLDGRPVGRLLELRRVLARKVAGDPLTVIFRRQGKTLTVRLTLGREAGAAG